MAQKNPSLSLAALPSELIDHITSHLPNRDIKNLRLTSISHSHSVRFRLRRVFISANPLDIKVLREIADHEEFRKDITEIIWDDTYVTNYKSLIPLNEVSLPPSEVSSKSSQHIDHENHCPKWFYRSCKDNMKDFVRSRGKDRIRPDHAARNRQLQEAMSPYDSYAYYYELSKKQQRVLSSKDDVDAFAHALDRFPSLSRVTITSRAHGRLFMPMYETPTIRAYPYGFVYPLPRDGCQENISFLWEDTLVKNKKRRYFIWKRGFCSALRMLAQNEQHNISEFVVEEHGQTPGVSHELFGATQQARDDFILLLKRPNFRRLDLAFDEDPHPLPGPSQESLMEMLSETTSLEHFSLSNSRTAGDWGKFAPTGWEYMTPSVPSEHMFNLAAKFPVRSIRHLTLQGFLVDKDKLVALLASLPNLRSVELHFVRFAIFMEQDGRTFRYKVRNYRDFLFDVRDTLGWRYRPAAMRPKVTIVLTAPRSVEGQVVQLDSDIDKFLYEEGENPFVPTQPLGEAYSLVTTEEVTAHKLCSGKGIELDEFEPAHERPNVDEETLTRLGVTGKEDDELLRPVQWGVKPSSYYTRR
ncbi:hypothetical protein FSARC_3821 [Fusarium sarcochroum]|uniref:F-box domain-containing protein n=1 Tax=Fusarium sarcochroum TaxID=1208366 RepID=A0A8H4XC54_9HYPO|nr:hypothetical protein FSARC_3821 [Fusarium sarcochroum]